MRKTLFFLLILIHFFSYTKKSQSGVFIIVPGTWSAFSRWHSVNSKFFKQLEKSVKKYNQHAITHKWTGGTSYKSRDDAAEELLRLVTSYPPETEIILLAHSHGANVSILMSNKLKEYNEKNNENHHIKILYTLGVPVDTKAYDPCMETIGYLYNMFSFNDFVQPVFGMYKRQYPNHPKIANLRIVINGKEPTHGKLHCATSAMWIPEIHNYISEKKGSFKNFSYEKSGIIYLYDKKEPEYKVDKEIDQLLKKDVYLNQKLPYLFIRKRSYPSVQQTSPFSPNPLLVKGCERINNKAQAIKC